MKLVIGMLMGLLTLGACYESPCPGVFRYITDEAYLETFGEITLTNIPKNTILDLRVNVSLAEALPTKYMGELILAKSVDETVDAMKYGDPIVFKILFPMQSPVPSIVEIKLNGELLCFNHRRVPGRTIHNIFYHHTLYPPKVEVEKTNVEDYNKCGSWENKGSEPTSSGGMKSPGGWPWLVAIYKKTDEGQMFICSGTLITQENVVMAASCVPKPGSGPYQLEVVFGIERLDFLNKRGLVHRSVTSKYGIKIHPAFNWESDSKADIAILTLDEPVTLSPNIRTLCLMAASMNYEGLTVGRSGFVAGWGKDNGGNQQAVRPTMDTVSVVSQNNCPTIVPFERPHVSFCGHHTDGVCNADLGSGLVMYDHDSKRYFLRGIASAIQLDKFETCVYPNYVTYTDVAFYVQWIKEQI